MDCFFAYLSIYLSCPLACYIILHVSYKLTLPQFLALLYADIFEYPLSKSEICKFQIANPPAGRAGYKLKIKSKIQTSNSYYGYNNGYYYLKARQKLINLRKQREKYSQEKMEIAERAGKWLKIIPSIRMVAVTGGVAVGNAKKNDDIDFLIVSAKGAIWTTRFLAIAMLELLGKRRRRNDKNYKNKVCLNMFMTENSLQIPKNEQDLFSAHEAAQVKILWSRGEVEKRWWKENEWINKYLQKFKDQSSNIKSNSKLKVQNINKFGIWILNLIYHLSFVTCNLSEVTLKQLQIAYMQNQRTKEIISDAYLRFHPDDAREWILREYQKRLRKYGLE